MGNGSHDATKKRAFRRARRSFSVFDLQFAFDIKARRAFAKGRATIFGAGHLSDTVSARNEGSDFLFVVTDLDPMVVNDDRAPQNRGVLADEIDQLTHGHVIEIDIVLRHDFTSWGDDVIGPVLRLGNDFLDVLDRKAVGKNVFLLIRDFLLIEPFLDFAATRATGGIIYFDHIHEL